jgi:hypothetical protein
LINEPKIYLRKGEIESTKPFKKVFVFYCKKIIYNLLALLYIKHFIVLSSEKMKDGKVHVDFGSRFFFLKTGTSEDDFEASGLRMVEADAEDPTLSALARGCKWQP